MGIISESNVLLHPEIELPAGVKVATEESHEGWLRMRTGGRRRLERSVRAKGWHFLPITEGVLRSGVGATGPKAVESALQQLLRRLGAHSHAVEVERIEVTRYPWFFLARVRVNPYRIQLEDVLPSACVWPAATGRGQRPENPHCGAEVYSSSCGRPELRDLLVAPRDGEPVAE